MSLIERAAEWQPDQRKERPSGPGGEAGPASAAVAPVDIPFGATVRDEPPEPAGSLPEEPIAIGMAALERIGFTAPGQVVTPTASEFRRIKRPLLRNILPRRGPALPNGRRIMVTSALPREGKTFCATHLALSIAEERDLDVLLVDADVARPSVPEVLGIDAGPGLMDALLDPGCDPGTLVHPTSVPKLSLMFAGRRHSQATELLASASMSQLLRRLSSHFPDRVIVFDSPPLLVTTEASVLAGHMGQIVLVVEAGKTAKTTVKSALAMLQGANAELSLLINKTPRPSKSSPDGYGYGYAYGST